jgi:signal transduction histidine kinase
VRWRIRHQLLLPLLLLLLGLCGLCAWMALAAAARARGQVEARVRDVAVNLGAATFPLTRGVLEQVKSLSGADYVLAGPDGKRVATFDGAPPLPPGVPLAEGGAFLRLGPAVVVGGRSYLCAGVRLWHEPNAGSSLYILYPESLSQDAVRQAVWPFLVLGGSVGLASVVLALGLGRDLSARVGDLERRTRVIAGGDFSPMPLPGRDDEIRDLTRSINDMAGRLAQLQEAVRRAERLRLLGQVSGGLAHQLRNGLAGARLAVQVFLRESDGGTDSAALDVALRQLTLLETRLKRFLDLGRQEGLRRDRCSLKALAGEAVELLRPQCRHAGTALRWQAPADDPEVTGDPGQLGQLLLNVLTNAAEAAGPGGWVEVTLKRDGPAAVLEVVDSGPGPPPELAGRLFEPFVTGKPEGVGLGLAVARQAAEAHGGSLDWHRGGGRTVFRITLPASHETRPGGG